MRLLQVIDQAGFAMYDTLLYLDTHPNDGTAMAYYQKQKGIYEEAMEQYSKQYGPLTITNIDNNYADCWEWMMQPWPWEISRKGRC